MFLALILCSSVAFAAPIESTTATSLTFDQGGNLGVLKADCAWVKQPSTSSEAELQIQWTTGPNNSPIDPAGSFDVTTNMPSMPTMNNSPTQLERVVDTQGNVVPGAYLVRNIWFTMGGQWDVVLTLVRPDGTQEAQEILLDL